MPVRILGLVALHLAFRHLAPPWAVVDWSDPGGWLTGSRPEDVAAALVRMLALAATGVQASLSVIAGSRRLLDRHRRAANTVVRPLLRRVAPLALVVGAALPATAMATSPAPDQRLPLDPPGPVAGIDVPVVPAFAATRDPASSVVVRPGDSMWRIAARHVAGPTAPYWVTLVDVNRPRFADVDLIHPGDTVLLPPVTPAG